MNAYEIARAEATRVVEAAYRKAVAAGELPEGTIPPVAVETPKDSSNGDWASTFAMQCAKPLHMAPRKIAESIVANLNLEGSCFDTVTIAAAQPQRPRQNTNCISTALLMVCSMQSVISPANRPRKC